MWVEIITIININNAENVSLLTCYAYINIQIYKMLTGQGTDKSPPPPDKSPPNRRQKPSQISK